MLTDRDRQQIEELTDSVNRVHAKLDSLERMTSQLWRVLTQIFSGERTRPKERRRWPW